MTVEIILTLALVAATGFIVWAVIMLERLHKAIDTLSSSIADVADGRANVYRYNGRIVITHKED